MPKIYRQKAAKDYPNIGIRKGDTYYCWKTRPGGRGKGILHRSKTYPRRSQLTSSGFLQTVYEIYDQDWSEPADLEQAAEALREAGEECQGSLDNMPESLQSAPTGEMLQTRIDACEEGASNFEEVAQEWQQAIDEIEGDEELSEEEKAEKLDEAKENAIQSISEPDWG